MAENQKTASGREVKRTGVTSKKMTALQKLKEARASNKKATELYEVEDEEKVFDEIDADEYERMQRERADDDFIVDDEGFGYKDHGGEIWDNYENENQQANSKSNAAKRRKLAQEEQHNLQKFMMANAQKKKPSGPSAAAKKAGASAKVNEQESKDIMNQLYNDLDAQDDDLEDAQDQINGTNGDQPISFNKQQAMYAKYEVQAPKMPTVPQANPFAKKRNASEITPNMAQMRIQAGQDEEQQQEDVDMAEPSAVQEPSMKEDVSMAASNQNSAINEKKMQIDQQQSAKKDEANGNGSLKPSIQDEWEKLKLQNHLMSTNSETMKVEAQAQLSAQDLPLPLNEDGSLSFFYIDAHEEQNGNEVYLFGKVYHKEMQSYLSCTILVRGLERTLFFVPKIKGKSRGTLTSDEEDKLLTNVHTELEEIRKRRFKEIPRFRSKGVSRKYCFEMPIPHGEHRLLKVKYPAQYPPLPMGLTGNTFEAVFGTQQSMLELFILKRKIKGPCWLTIKNANKVQNLAQRKSWCKHECIVDNFKDISCTVDDLNKPSPPLVAVTFSVKTCRNEHNTNEIAMLSCIVQNRVQQDGPTTDDKFQHFTYLRKLDKVPLPYDIHNKIKNKSIQVFQSERQLIEQFITRLFKLDPDLLVSHNLCTTIIETLLARIQFLHIPHWSRIGRLRRDSMPIKRFDSGVASWIPRAVTCGRLLVDTFLNAKELVRETNYDLGYLAKTQLSQERHDFDDDLLPKFYQDSQTLEKLCQHTEQDAFLTYKLMMHLMIVPLTKQLTTIAGNLWFRSLQNARAERNEWLLMHEFWGRKFLCPDKKNLNSKQARNNLFGENGDAGDKPAAGRKRGKAKYGGGLVLDPKAGFYDSIILLLDFNSLYPSIIQEYSLCFTTVQRRHTQNFDGSPLVQQQALVGAKEGGDSGDEEELENAEQVELPITSGTANNDAILPNVLRNLVQKRKLVKDQIKKEKDPVKLGQLDIRQKALKLTANSMYGCLGFSSSRFYAQAIAALITRTGRETLMKTKDVAETKLGFNVVYGDTDSIMINTGTKNLRDSIEMGKKLKLEVNVLYKCLEIEIDGVFKSLLLMKKKKYAAIKIDDFAGEGKKFSKEIKGLDMVRRDWCILSKEVGNRVLDEILSDKEREKIIIDLNDYFQDVSNKLKNHLFNISQYIITKQLTKAPGDYSDIKALPHVAVALKKKAKGASDSELVNNFIPYVICQVEPPKDSGKKDVHLSDKAFSPDELIASKGQLQIDTQWYIEQQLLPPITRLIEHIEGIEVDFVAQCLGADPKNYKYHGSHGDKNGVDEEAIIPQAILKTETQESLKDRTLAVLTIRCPSCHKKHEFSGLRNPENKSISGMLCPHCSAKLPEKFIMNRITLYLRQLIEYYYSGNYICMEPSCRTKTRQLTVDGRCVVRACKGRVVADRFTERATNDSLRYLQGLFDVEKYITEQASANNAGAGATAANQDSQPHEMEFKKIKKLIDEVIDRSGYNKVDLSVLFSFMDK